MNVVPLQIQENRVQQDIRLLGRILGDTVRQQQGDAVYETVERIRQISIQFRRDHDDAARGQLETILNSLSRERTIEVVRAFSYFSHLANIAEDQQNIRAGRAVADVDAPPHEGTIAAALEKARAWDVSRAELQSLFASILVCPVLTAHPTEVRCKSVLDREMEVAALLADRDRMQMTPTEMRANEEAMARAVLTLWQTSLLRRDRPTVIDEIANGLSYFNQTFLRELPRVYVMLEDQLAAMDPAWNTRSFRPLSAWAVGSAETATAILL